MSVWLSVFPLRNARRLGGCWCWGAVIARVGVSRCEQGVVWTPGVLGNTT